MSAAQAEFWSKVARRYDRVVDLQIGGRTRAMVRERVEREERCGRLVELGCGTGFFTRALAERADHVVATDLSPAMLAIAQGRVAAPNLRFQTENCQRTSFRDCSFDAAFLSLVLHFTDPARTLAEMRRVLKLFGTLIIANPDREEFNRIDRFRSSVRIVYHGVTGYRVKPPKQFAANVGGARLARLLDEHGFAVTHAESVRDASRSSNVPIQYVRAVRVK